MRVAIVLAIFLLFGCAAEQPMPILVMPDSAVRNIFERCKARCLDDGKTPAVAHETRTKWWCDCVPFDAIWWKP